jgi:hypothetical protein
MKEDIMNELFEGTPINLIKDSEVKWQISYDIYPIQLTQAVRIVDFIAEDKFFENFDVGLVSQNGRVTSIVVKAERNWLDLASMSHAFEKRLNDLFDRYLESNGGYAAAQA